MRKSSKNCTQDLTQRSGKTTLKFNCNALSPTKDVLKRRLNQSYPHMPVVPDRETKDQVCQLCGWAHGRFVADMVDKQTKYSAPSGTQKNVMYCKACEVKICL